MEDNQYYAIWLIRDEKYYAGFAFQGSKKVIIVSEKLEEAKLFKHFGSEISGSMEMLLGLRIPHKVEIVNYNKQLTT